jgi:mRNA interferase MazF
MPTQSMTTWCKGDVVLVPIGFTGQSGAKRRPAVIISSDQYNTRSPDLMIASITGNLQAVPHPGDHLLHNWQEAGLLRPSLVQAKIATVETSIVERKLGRLSRDDSDRTRSRPSRSARSFLTAPGFAVFARRVYSGSGAPGSLPRGRHETGSPVRRCNRFPTAIALDPPRDYRRFVRRASGSGFLSASSSSSLPCVGSIPTKSVTRSPGSIGVRYPWPCSCSSSGSPFAPTAGTSCCARCTISRRATSSRS